MAGSVSTQQYETRPLEVWQWMKELRRKHFRATWTAHERGELVIIGVVESFLGVLAGMGDFANPSYGPYFTQILRDPNRARAVLEETDRHGFGHDICSSMRLHIGQMLLGMSTRNPLGGTTVPDFVFQFNFCQEVSKMGQLMSEHLGIPYFVLDVPYFDSPVNRKYLVQQLHDAIEWMEKTTGRKYDDEKLVEATKNEWQSMRLWAAICNLNKAVPAPVDARHLWSLRLPTVTLRHKAETVRYLEALRDEVQQRIQDGISARGWERARLMLEQGPPFLVPVQRVVLGYPNQYGAVLLGGEGIFLTFGAWRVRQDGSWEVPQTLEERGLQVRNREEALAAQVELYLGHRTIQSYFNLGPRPLQAVKRMRDWQAQGAIFHVNRGCMGQAGGLALERQALQREGIPNTFFEATHTDPRDIDLVQITERLDSFLESLGLKKLEVKEGGEEEVAE